MDFLNKFFDQLRDLFASMTPGARVTTGVLLAVVALSVGYLFRHAGSGPDEYLFGGQPLSPREVIAIQAAFGQAGLKDFEVVGSSIRIPRGEKDRYIAAVADAGALPRSAKDYLSEAINNSSPFTSSRVQQQQFQAARERELSHIIEQHEWVDEASVIYDVTTVRGPRSKTIASATVSVLPMPGEPLDSRRERNLQNLVAAAFTSMKPEDVSVNNLGGDGAFAGSRTDPERYEQPYLREKARFEEEVKTEVLTHLSYIPGVRVEVNAVLDNVLQSESITVRPEGQAATIYEKTKTDFTNETTADGGGQPGVAPNSAVGPDGAQVAERQNKSETRREDNEFTYKPFESRSAQVLSGLTPKEVYTSVQIPRDYVVQVWRQKKIQAEGEAPDLVDDEELRLVKDEIITSVQTAVEPLMPDLSAGEDDFKQVQVVVIDSLPPREAEEASLAAEALWWTGRHASTLAMIGLAVVSLLMLRSMVMSTPGDGGAAAAAPTLKLDDDEEPEQEPPERREPSRPKLKLKKADSLTDDLTEMVREDPDAAATILKTWISNAS